MAKTLAGVLAVSIAALLFAGCGDQSPGLSGAQRERCDSLKRTIETSKKLRSEMADLILSGKGSVAFAIDASLDAGKRQEAAEKERATLACP